MNAPGTCVGRPAWWLATSLAVSLLFGPSPMAWAQDTAPTGTAAPAPTATAAAPAATAPAEAKPAAPAEAEAEAEAPAAPTPGLNKTWEETSVALDTVWTIIAAFLVMWMQAGFALVETGLTRAKNAVNICMKNLLDYSFGSLAFWAVGFGIMFGNGGDLNWFMGTQGWFLNPDADFGSLSWTSVPLDCKFFFQLVFAATAATIVSGAMAERTKFPSYMAYSIIISLLIYPISGHWIWGGGWLSAKGFWDFAGSTVVHSLGGWLALMGACILGPRLGKYGPDGKPRAIPGHNLVLVTLGVFILWLGWFGFNPGSTMAADVMGFSRVTVNTNAAGALGAVTALVTAKLLFGKWEATMALNGVLAGLVAITAPCYWVNVPGSLAIGGIAGVLVVLSVVFFDKYAKIDDPVGAISVHGVCGAWGTLSLGLFAHPDYATGSASPTAGLLMGGDAAQLIAQATGVGAVFLWAVVTGGICFYAIKLTMGLRVSEQEEMEGLDFGEHGNEAYHGFAFVRESATS